MGVNINVRIRRGGRGAGAQHERRHNKGGGGRDNNMPVTAKPFTTFKAARLYKYVHNESWPNGGWRAFCRHMVQGVA